MHRGFWDKLEKPILALAPLYDVTDVVFRHVIAKYGKPDVCFTEFTSTDGLQSAGRKNLLHHLKYDETQRPIVAQIFGTKPEKFEQTAKDLVEMGFDGIDINMGCPDKGIIKTGSCAGLFKTPQLARDLVLATKRGAGNLPVSVKIRIGDTKIDWENWVGTLLTSEPAAITIHLRTRKEMSKVPAHWEEMPKIVKFIHDHTTVENRPHIIGNGDVLDIADAFRKIDASGCDGVMLGRAIFGNPWLFAQLGEIHSSMSSSGFRLGLPLARRVTRGSMDSRLLGNDIKAYQPTTKEKLEVLLEHTKLYEQTFFGIKPFDIMKRHFKAYVSGFSGAAELREQLYHCNSASEVEKVLKSTNFGI